MSRNSFWRTKASDKASENVRSLDVNSCDFEKNKEVIVPFYAHLSRLFVSTYATFLTVCGALLVLLYYYSSISQLFIRYVLALAFFVSLVFACAMLMRVRAFASALQYIERNCLILADGRNVQEWFEQTLYPKTSRGAGFHYRIFGWPAEKKHALSEMLGFALLAILFCVFLILSIPKP